MTKDECIEFLRRIELYLQATDIQDEDVKFLPETYQALDMAMDSLENQKEPTYEFGIFDTEDTSIYSHLPLFCCDDEDYIRRLFHTLKLSDEAGDVVLRKRPVLEWKDCKDDD